MGTLPTRFAVMSEARPGTSRGPQQPALADHRHVQLAVAVLVEQHGDLVAVVALHGARAPALADHPGADGEGYVRRDGRRRRPGRGPLLVVVAVAAEVREVLAEVRQQERAPAAGVLGV